MILFRMYNECRSSEKDEEHRGGKYVGGKRELERMKERGILPSPFLILKQSFSDCSGYS